MQPLGQHFLKNRSIIIKIIAALEIKKGDAIIEIGSGHGELTIPLAAACVDAGATLTAVEKDEQLAGPLKKSMESEGAHAVDMLHADALTFIKSGMHNISGAKLVGNIPYYITGKLLRTVGELKQKPERCIFMVQKEVAERIAARPTKMNRLAASVQFWSEIQTIANISRDDFNPPPKVDSAVILLKTKIPAPSANPERYYETVRALFAQPRKTILNNLSERVENGGKNEISLGLKKIHIDPTARPQNLDIGDIISIAEARLWG